MNGEFPCLAVREWQASYYVKSKRKWSYGMLKLTQTGIVFNPSDQNESNLAYLSVQFGSFIDVKKSKSSYIFPVLTIVTNSEGYLFGSFNDRDSVYHTVLHFWKFCLIPDEKALTCTQKTGPRTKLAQDLLSLASDSENTMSQAATVLHHQGEQIVSSMATMDDLHNDLDVADRVVSGLETWLGQWSASHGVPIIDPVVVKQTDVCDVYDFHILYARVTGSVTSAFLPGTLWISLKDGVTILGEKQEIIQHFGPGKTPLSRIKILNPWEIIFSHFRIGQPDLSIHILSTLVIQAVKPLEKCCRCQIDYVAPVGINLPLQSTSSNNKENRDGLLGLSGRQELSSLGSQFSHTEDSNVAAGSMALKDKEVVSEQDADQLSHMLSNLKSMALGVEKEQNQQLENLDSLLTSVDRANSRINQTERRVQSLLRK